MDIKGFEIIAHRANLDVPNAPKENSIAAIELCLKYGISMELDIWFKDKKWWLGHDKPETPIEPSRDPSLTFNNKIYWHTKNIEAFEQFITRNDFASHFFFHDIEKLAPLFDIDIRTDVGYKIQSKVVNRFWTAGAINLEDFKSVKNKTICVLQAKVEPSIHYVLPDKCAGICTDEPIKLYNSIIQHGR